MAKKKPPPKPPDNRPEFFVQHCPRCKNPLHLVRIVGEPTTNPQKLGTVILCCYECYFIYVTEGVADKHRYLGPAHFRRKLKKVDHAKTLRVYQDMLLLVDAITEYLVHASKDPVLTESALHLISSTFVFLSCVRQQLHIELSPNV